MKKKALLIAALLVLLPILLLAQEKQIRGTVTDESGTPVPDVTVTLKGSSTGTKTDAAGSFTLTVPDNGKNTELIFHMSISSLNRRPSPAARFLPNLQKLLATSMKWW